MKKIIIYLLLVMPHLLMASIFVPDISVFDLFSTENRVAEEQKDGGAPSVFELSLGSFEGELNLAGYWYITLGFATGLTYNPDLSYILDIDGMSEGLIFTQERLLSINVKSAEGISFSLFAPDDINKTEFALKYESDGFLKEFYLANTITKKEINPYRTLMTSRAQDIATGFYWGNSLYRGHFDMKFDSAKFMSEKFTGNKKLSEGTLKGAAFIRGVYYYLPDTSIMGNVNVYVSNDTGEDFSSTGVGKYFREMTEGSDYIINRESGTIVFLYSVEEETVLIHYKTSVNGKLLQCGTTGTGENGILNSSDCTLSSVPDLFVVKNGTNYLILAQKNTYSPFEEKNSYKVVTAGVDISDQVFAVKDANGNYQIGYKYTFDQTTGCVRVRKNTIKGDPGNVYPFYDTFGTEFYCTVTPQTATPGFVVSYSYMSEFDGLKLSSLPLAGTVTVYVNSIESDKVSVNYTTGELIFNDEIGESDVIEITYLSSDEDDYFLTFAEQNDFRITKNILLSDSFYFKMPVKLWETSYYDSPHQGEFLYNTGVKGDFSEYLPTKKGKMTFSLDGTVSLYIPEMKNLSLIEDFERDKTGWTLSLDYRDYYPANLPTATFTALSAYTWGKLYYRNMYEDGVVGNSLISVFSSSVPQAAQYKTDNPIGPYSSCDGYTVNVKTGQYTRKKNSESIIADIDLDPQEGVSFTLPVYDADTSLTAYTALTMLAECIDLTGAVHIYMDAGKVSEIFQSNSDPVTETSDEGISYYLDTAGVTLTKGKNDGKTSSNDFDENEVLTGDVPNYISRLLPLTDNSSDESLELDPGDRGFYTFTIEDPLKLDGAIGLRITIVNSGTANVSGKILINQLRLTETGWFYNTERASRIDEIFPAEDDFLLDHIFSQENAARDKELHYTRSSERSLRVAVSDEDADFYIGKGFTSPIDATLYKTMGFYILKEDSTSFGLDLELTSLSGKTYTTHLDPDELSSGKWHEMSIDLEKVAARFSDNPYITGMKLLIDNNEMSDFTFFVDEFFLENINLPVGGAVKAGFHYYDKQISLAAGSVPIFSNPEIQLESTVLSKYFAEEPVSTLKESKATQSTYLGCRFATMDLVLSEKNALQFSDAEVTPFSEDTLIKISRSAADQVPLFFTLSYEYQDSRDSDGYEYDKVLYADLYSTNQYYLIKNGIKSTVYKRELITLNTEAFLNIGLYTAPVNMSINSKMKAGDSDYTTDGSFSMQHLYTSFRDDFKGFAGSSTSKTDSTVISSDFQVLPFMTYENDMSSLSVDRYSGVRGYYTFTNTTKIKNGASFHLPERSGEFLSSDFSRVITDTEEFTADTLGWGVHFYNKKLSYTNSATSFFVRPFPDTLLKDRVTLIDSIDLSLKLGTFLPQNYFIPLEYTFSVTGSYYNSNTYSKEMEYALKVKGYYQAILLRAVTEAGYEFDGSITTTNETEEQTYYAALDNYIKMNREDNFEFSSDLIYSYEYNKSGDTVYAMHKVVFDFDLDKYFYKVNSVTGDTYGPQVGVGIENRTKFTICLAGDDDYVQKPLALYLTPHGGYRFNRNITIDSQLKLAYSIECSSITAVPAHKLGMEITVSGKLSF